MTVPHEPWLVALSMAIAVQGSFVGLSLARDLDRAEGFRRRLALAGASLTLATGVWSMHFVGMLAANFPSAIDYLVLPTLVSFLICVIVVGVGVYVAHAPGTARLADRRGRDRDGARHQPDALCRHVGGASGRADPPGAALCRRLGGRLRRGERASRFGRLDSRPTRAAAVRRARWRSGWRFPACITPPWRACGSIPHVSTSRASSAPIRRLSRNTLALLTTLVAFGVSGAFLLSLVPDRGAADVRRAVATSPRRRAADRPRRRSNSPASSRRRAAAPRADGDPRRKGRAVAGYRARRYFRRARQRALHLCLRRRAGIFLQSVDQRRRGAPRSGAVPARPSQPYRRDPSHRAGETRGRERDRRIGHAGAVQHSDRARALSRGQTAASRRRRASIAPHFVNCVSMPDAFRAAIPPFGAIFGRPVYRALIVRRTQEQILPSTSIRRRADRRFDQGGRT